MDWNADKSIILSNDRGRAGVFARASAEQAAWPLLNMVALRLDKGGQFEIEIADYEYLAVILGGRCHIRTSRGDFLDVGRRPDVFRGLPYAIYLPRQTEFAIEALSDGLEVASCWAPTTIDRPVTLVTPQQVQTQVQGGGRTAYQRTLLAPPLFQSHHILAFEMYIPGGNWAPYPPHKHEGEQRGPDGSLQEADLDALYFYKFDHPESRAMQRISSVDGLIDIALTPGMHDIVIHAGGYTTIASPPESAVYTLCFMAGSSTQFAAREDPRLSWMHDIPTGVDPRLPLVDRGMEPPPPEAEG